MKPPYRKAVGFPLWWVGFFLASFIPALRVGAAGYSEVRNKKQVGFTFHDTKWVVG